MAGNKTLCGIDESGRCDVLGSLFYVMVTCSQYTLTTLINRCEANQCRIRDSKQMTLNQIKKVFELARICGVNIYVEEIKATDFGKEENLPELCMDAQIKLLSNLKDARQYQTYIDNNEPRFKNWFYRFMQRAPPRLRNNINKAINQNLFQVDHKMDEKQAICSLAGIMAKYFKEQEKDWIKKEFKVTGTDANQDAVVDFLRKVKDNPPDIVRTSWVTFQNLDKEESKKEEDKPKKKQSKKKTKKKYSKKKTSKKGLKKQESK